MHNVKIAFLIQIRLLKFRWNCNEIGSYSKITFELFCLELDTEQVIVLPIDSIVHKFFVTSRFLQNVKHIQLHLLFSKYLRTRRKG